MILAEGTNSMLSERCLGNARPKANQMAVGIKEVFELPSDVIEDRFLLPEGEGAAMLFVGDCTKAASRRLPVHQQGVHLAGPGGHHLPGRRRSRNEVPVYQMLEDFKNHPAVAPIIRGARWSSTPATCARGRLRHDPEIRLRRLPDRRRDAGLCMNMGYQCAGWTSPWHRAAWRARRRSRPSTRAT